MKMNVKIASISLIVLINGCASHQVNNDAQKEFISPIRKLCVVSPTILPQMKITVRDNVSISEASKKLAQEKIAEAAKVFKENVPMAFISALKNYAISAEACKKITPDMTHIIGFEIQHGYVKMASFGMAATDLAITVTVVELPKKEKVWGSGYVTGDRMAGSSGPNTETVEAFANNVVSDLQGSKAFAAREVSSTIPTSN